MRFCAGTSKRDAAARNPAKSVAVFSAKIALAVVPPSSAVQRSETAYSPGGMLAPSPVPSGTTASVDPVAGSSAIAVKSSVRPDTIGPCTVERTSIVTSSPPATRNVSVRVSSGTSAPSRQYESPSTRSR